MIWKLFTVKRIDRYIFQQAFAGMMVATGVISIMIFLINFVEMSRSIGNRAREVNALDLFYLAGLQTPSVVLLLMPFTVLIGIMASFVNLNRRSELIVMRAFGMSAWRFILPAALAGAILGLSVLLVLNPIAASLDKKFQKEQTKIMENYLGVSEKTIWLREGDGKIQMIIHAKRQGPGPETTLIEPVIFSYSVGSKGHLDFQQRLDAKSGRLEGRLWHFSDVRTVEPGGVAAHYDHYDIASSLEVHNVVKGVEKPSALSVWQLPKTIATIRKSGFKATGYVLQLDLLLLTPLLFFAMASLAASFSLSLARLGGLAKRGALVIALGFGVFFLNQICRLMGRSDILPPAFAALTPCLVALLSSGIVLSYTEDG